MRRNLLAVMLLFVAASVGRGQGVGESSSVAFDSAEVSPERTWFRGEYLLWRVKDAPLGVPLLTASSPADAGVLGRPSTRVLLGGGDLEGEAHSGGRFTLGTWFDCERTLGAELGVLFLGTRSVRRSVSVPGDAQGIVLGIPYLDVNPANPGEAASVASSPNAFSGAALLSARTHLWGAEANGIANLTTTPGLRADLLGGFRHLNLSERLKFLTSSPDFPPVPTNLYVSRDVFETDNLFYGGQLGGRVQLDRGRFLVEAVGKVALGLMHQEVDIRGRTVTNDFTGSAGPTTTFPGGYFTQRTNLGNHSQDRFAVAPEFNLNLAFRITPRALISVGYTFLYVSEVVRPGDQVDHAINSSQSEALRFTPAPGPLVGPARPAFTGTSTDFWTQGVNFGLEFRF